MTCGSEWYSRKGYYKQKILRPSGNPWAEGGFMQSMKLPISLNTLPVLTLLAQEPYQTVHISTAGNAGLP